MSEPDPTTNESAIPPALTPEQWRTIRALEPDCSTLDAVTFLEIALGPTPTPHAAAAALLHQCPYGLSEEMVEAVRTVLERAELHASRDEETGRALEPARAALARLRALLPPPEGTP